MSPTSRRVRRLKMLGCFAVWIAPFAALPQHVHEHAPATTRQFGVISFQNSGAPAAQKDFLQGLALLHNFQYPAAAAAFRRAQGIDSGFALAYWGEAMTHDHPIWAQQDLVAARAVLAKLGPTPDARRAKAPTEREKKYLDAVELLYGEGDEYDRDRRYALAMEQLHKAYPDDIDATCFYALALLGTAHAGRDVSIYMRAAALMQDVFERNPNHPGAAHYLIHSVDDAAHAPLGLKAANAYSKIAPDSPHALHMTSHIYLALGMWRETVAANEAAIRVGDRNQRAAKKDAPLRRCGHVHIWLAYGYLQQERFEKARGVVKECGEEMRTRPVTASGRDSLVPDETSAGAFYDMRTRHLIDSDEWSGPMARRQEHAGELPLVAQFSRDFANAYRVARQGPSDAVAQAIARAEQSAERLTAAVVEAWSAGHPLRLVPGIEVDQLKGLALLKQGERDRALEFLSKAAAAERSLPADFGPPSLYKPANELLGEVLLDLARPQDARAAFETAQLLAPGRTQSLKGLLRCAKALGDTELAASVEAKLAQIKSSGERES